MCISDDGMFAVATVLQDCLQPASRAERVVFVPLKLVDFTDALVLERWRGLARGRAAGLHCARWASRWCWRRMSSWPWPIFFSAPISCPTAIAARPISCAIWGDMPSVAAALIAAARGFEAKHLGHVPVAVEVLGDALRRLAVQRAAAAQPEEGVPQRARRHPQHRRRRDPSNSSRAPTQRRAWTPWCVFAVPSAMNRSRLG